MSKELLAFPCSPAYQQLIVEMKNPGSLYRIALGKAYIIGKGPLTRYVFPDDDPTFVSYQTLLSEFGQNQADPLTQYRHSTPLKKLAQAWTKDHLLQLLCEHNYDPKSAANLLESARNQTPFSFTEIIDTAVSDEFIPDFSLDPRDHLPNSSLGFHPGSGLPLVAFLVYKTLQHSLQLQQPLQDHYSRLRSHIEDYRARYLHSAQ